MSLKSQQDEDMRVIGDRLREARKLRGVSQTKLAELIGTSVSQVSMVEHEQSGTSIRTAMAAAQVLNVSMDYLVGWVDDPRPTSEIATHLQRATARLLDLEWDEEEHLEVDTEDFVGVNEIIASAGTGDDVINERITDRVKFRRPWMRKHGLKGRLCRILKVTGEGMEPTLPDGASILVNLEQQERRDGRMFVLRIGDAIVVKRLILNAEAGWLLQSDNPNRKAWPTQPWPAEARIVGEVKWLGRTFT